MAPGKLRIVNSSPAGQVRALAIPAGLAGRRRPGRVRGGRPSTSKKNPSIAIKREENPKAFVGFLLFGFLDFVAVNARCSMQRTSSLSGSGTRRVVYDDDDD